MERIGAEASLKRALLDLAASTPLPSWSWSTYWVTAPTWSLVEMAIGGAWQAAVVETD